MSADTGLHIWLDTLFSRAPAGDLIEVRFKLDGGGMHQSWHPCDRREEAASTVARLGRDRDTYVGVAPRQRRHGGSTAIAELYVVWADCDGRSAADRLIRFPARPTLMVRSGSGCNVHGYWALEAPVAPDDGATMNRRLAAALGADSRSTDAARILRPPGTWNHKSGGGPVQLMNTSRSAIYTLGDLERHAPPLRNRGSVRPPALARAAERHADPLLAIAASKYVEALTGRSPDRAGFVRCPWHSDGNERTPSLKVYDNGSWTCFGSCEPPPGRDHLGGDIYTFAAQLWGLSTRHDFPELRCLLLGVFDRSAVA